MRRFAILALVALGLALGGCAGTGGDPRDPLEPMNRAIYGLNEGFDQVIAKPVATGYRDVVPGPVRGWVRNFFANIADIFIGLNNILQGKPDDGLQDWVRFAVNSFFGVFGINDVASDMGLEKHDEDFGQTFGRWGAGPGFYLVLPLLGPSSLRDGVGTAFDLYTDPVTDVKPNRVANSAVVVRAIARRADLLDATRLLEEAALDKYVFLRDASLQRRRSLVYDGHPPREREEDQDEPAEPPQAPGEKHGDAQPAPLGSVFLPRVPDHYEAVMAVLETHDRNR